MHKVKTLRFAKGGYFVLCVFSCDEQGKLYFEGFEVWCDGELVFSTPNPNKAITYIKRKLQELIERSAGKLVVRIDYTNPVEHCSLQDALFLMEEEIAKSVNFDPNQGQPPRPPEPGPSSNM